MPLPDQPTPPRQPVHVILYSPLWMDTTFRTRAYTEALLSPEREAGRLTPHDYDASVDFLTNYHRQYPIIGALIATALILPFRNPKWTQTKSAATCFTFGFGGYAFGRMAFLKGHFNYLRSIENPHGFQNAMENIQSQIGSPNGGVVIERTYQISPEHMDPDQLQENVPQLILPQSSSGTSFSPPPTAHRTKWDNIRAANTNGAHNSSWDKLRQTHEKKKIKSDVAEETFLGDLPVEKIDGDAYDNNRRKT